MVSELLLAVNQNQPLGNERFYETIERMAGQRREARPRGRSPLSGNVANEDVKGQGGLGAVRHIDPRPLTLFCGSVHKSSYYWNRWYALLQSDAVRAGIDPIVERCSGS
jgi:hypothetical protein